MIKIKCKNCGKIFETYPSLKSKYCSRGCVNEAKKGTRGWNKGMKGLKPWHNISGLRPHKKGEYKHSKETLKKLSLSHKGQNPWNKGKGTITSENERIRDSIEYSLWREAVFARDNWICQKCGKQGGILNPHHIHNFADYPKLRLAINNGVTLCEKCHKKFHRLFGQRNNTNKQLLKFLN